MPADCPWESQVVASILAGEWSLGTSEALRDHAKSCASCADVVLLAGLLAEDRAADDVQVPDAGAVWWRLQRRAQQEAAERVARSIGVAEALAAASAVGLLVALAPRLAQFLAAWRDAALSRADLPGSSDLGLAAGLTGTLPLLPWLAALTLLTVLFSVACYLVLADD
jgi:hypothetical protein